MRTPLALLAFVCGTGAALVFACVPDYGFSGDGADAGPDGTGGNDAGPDGGPSLARSTIVIGTDEYSGAICAFRNGKVYCWGDDRANDYGELGFPAGSAAIANPLAISARALADQLSVGGDHSCALYGRQVYCRGRNEAHQRGSTAAGNGPTETPVNGLPAEGVDFIAAGEGSTCALIKSPAPATPANVYCWGYQADGALGRPVTDTRDQDTAWGVLLDPASGTLLRNATSLAVGLTHACAITADKKVLCWGSNRYLQTGPIPPSDTSCACSGTPQEVRLPGGEEAIQLALGERHSCALAKSGKVFCWGANDLNQLGVATPPATTCTNYMDAGTVACTGQPVQVAALTGIVDVRAGIFHACALDASHHVFCWGGNYDGILGHGDTSDHTTPIPVLDLTTTAPATFDEIAMGGMKSCGRRGGDVYCWGSGVLGTGVNDGGQPDGRFPQLVVGW